MIFSDSEREHYRKELEAASKAGDLKRVKRLIDNIRLLGDIRENAPIPINTNSLLEYMKQQEALNKEVNEDFDKHTAQLWGEMFEGGVSPLEYLLNKHKSITSKINQVVPSLDDDIVGFHSPPPYSPKSFHDVLRLGFKESGWTW